ncbi:MAG TPA: porin [Candidatus Acidoferrales bacterium]|nr:porin [Candidatus Acidoferrales bacterium]
MRIAKTFTLLLAMACIALGARAQNSGKNSPDESAKTAAASTAADAAKPADAVPAKAAAPVAATREEVEQLRMEVAELKAELHRLLEAKTQPAPAAAAAFAKADASAAAAPVTAVVAQPAAQPAGPSEPADVEPAGFVEPSMPAAQKGGIPMTAGWNGEHFFIQSPDGQFKIQPYGYVQTDFRSYDGDGAPANTFTVRRARFGFQGNYGDHWQYGILTDVASSSGATVRDVYLNFKYNPEFQVQGGQFKEPFAQEVVAGVTNLDFVERGLQSLLYPSAGSAFRSPGLLIHGDLDGGVMQYWAGIFDGKGYTGVNNTTSVPETVGRVRFYPWRKDKGSVLQGLSFGGSMSYSYSRGLSGELTPRMTLPDSAYTFFPQFAINGNVWRYEGEFTFLHGPWGFRDEYVQAMFDRTGVGTLQFGGLGFQNLPTVRFRAWNSSATYLLTGERRPENGTPRVKHPVFGPETPGSSGRGWGAWELGFRYSGLEGKEPGIFFNNIYTPENVPGFNQKTDQFSAGLNWYLNYWVRYQTTVDVNRLKDPSTIGAIPQTYLVFEQRIQFRF